MNQSAQLLAVGDRVNIDGFENSLPNTLNSEYVTNPGINKQKQTANEIISKLTLNFSLNLRPIGWLYIKI